MYTHTKDFLESLTPRKALEVLIAGNKRFVNNLKINRNLQQQMNDTASGQYPFAVVLSCMDSRTSVEMIFDQGLGDIFSIRIAGNIVNEDILGSLEYACQVTGSKLIIVLGHTKCGAIKGALDNVEMGHLTGLLQKIQPALHSSNVKTVSNNEADPESIASANVLQSVEQIIDKSDIIRRLLKKGSIAIAGGMYSVENGKVEFIKEIFSNEDSSEALHASELLQ